MTIRNSIHAFAILLSVGSLSEARAGEPVVPVSVAGPPEPIFSGSVAGGYDSTYVFRGVDFGADAIWTGIDMNLAMTDELTFNFGAWYINPTGGGTDNDELDLYAFLTQSFGDFELGVGFTEYFFPEAGGDAPEAALKLGYSIASVDLGFLYAYDFEADGSYLELNAGHSIELNDRISLDLGGGISYADSYYGVSGFNHVFVTASLPIAITETLTFSPYISSTWAIDSLERTGEGDHLYGGASVSVEF